MKNKLFAFLFLFLLLAACNKQKSIVKKLTGEWNIYSYTFQENNGLSYNYDAKGILRFENCGNEFCGYELDMTFTKSGQNIAKHDLGEYKVEKDGEHFTINRSNSDGTISTFLKNRILLINKEQMKMLIQDEFGVHHFVLEK